MLIHLFACLSHKLLLTCIFVYLNIIYIVLVASIDGPLAVLAACQLLYSFYKLSTVYRQQVVYVWQSIICWLIMQLIPWKPANHVLLRTVFCQKPRTDADSKFQDPLIYDPSLCSSETSESYRGVLLYKRLQDPGSWHKATYGQRKRAAQVSHRTSWWSC